MNPSEMVDDAERKAIIFENYYLIMYTISVNFRIHCSDSSNTSMWYSTIGSCLNNELLKRYVS